ncbi:MAG TPA: site-2 protease family protein [Ktedonobacterales bacterium]|nr:site-2 protease family protein [Ktedonobacterales bacterium]
MIGPTLRIATLFGIPIRIDISWLLVFVIFVYAITQNFFKPLFPAGSDWVAVSLAVVTIFFFFVSVLLHELAHSLVAITNGLRVKAIALFILGGVSQLEGEPHNPWVEFWMALAGPLTSLLIGIICGVLCLSFGGAELAQAFVGRTVLYEPVSAAAAVLFWLSLQNLLMFGFNILPGFPMDGGRMVRAFIWGVSHNYSMATRIASWIGRGVGYLFLVGGGYYLFTGQLTGLWLLLVGFFLLTAARAGLNQAAVREILRGYQVGQLMRPNPLMVPGQLSLELLVGEYFRRFDYKLYPVQVNGAIAGVITPALVQRMPRKDWESRHVWDALAPLGPEYVIGPERPAQEAFDRMSANGTGGLLVMEGERLLGVATQGEMLRLTRIIPPRGPAQPPTPPFSPSLPASPFIPPDPSDHYERFGP